MGRANMKNIVQWYWGAQKRGIKRETYYMVKYENRTWKRLRYFQMNLHF